MEYRQDTPKENKVRYVWEDGELKKKYFVLETDNGIYLRDKKIMDGGERANWYYKEAVFKTEAEARG